MYVQMAINNPSFQRLMSLILNPDNLGILHHCAAGRDRTGIGTAFILLALGVPRETIIEDYLLSNQTLIPMNEQMKEQLTQVMPAEEVADIIAKLTLRRSSWRPCSRRSTRLTEASNRFWSANLA